MKEVWQKATEQVCAWTKGPPRHSETWLWWVKLLRRKDAICYGIKPKQQAIGISIKMQDEMQEVLLLHKKRQGKSLLVSWRVQQERAERAQCKTSDPAPMTTASRLCTRDPLPPVVSRSSLAGQVDASSRGQDICPARG